MYISILSSALWLRLSVDLNYVNQLLESNPESILVNVIEKKVY